MARAQLAQVYMCKSAALLEIGEEFYIFPASEREYGLIKDLEQRVRECYASAADNGLQLKENEKSLLTKHD